MHFDTLTGVADAIRRKEVSATEVTSHLLDRIATYDPRLASFSELLEQSARAEAAELDRRLSAGDVAGPLHGVPIAVKSLYDVRGASTSAGTVVWADRIADRDATLVRRLRDAGAVILGTLAMSEGALAAHHPELGTPINPWGPDLWVGASSSGSGVATAAGFCYASLGTDTGGSIRTPSAANGLSGLKPTWGRVSRAGVVEFAGSLDSPGPIARNVLDVATVFDVISGPDAADPVTLARPRPDLVAACLGASEFAGTARIGVDAEFLERCDGPTRDMLMQAAAVFRALGVEIVDVQLPSVDAMVDDWTPACAVEAAVVHRESYLAQPDRYGPEFADLVRRGLDIPATEYREMLRRRADFAGRFREAIADVDAVLLQVTGIAAPTAAQMRDMGVGAEWREGIMKAACPVNAAGLPTMTLQGGRTGSGAPLGFQLVGRPDGESAITALAHAFQRVTDHHRQHPDLDG